MVNMVGHSIGNYNEHRHLIMKNYHVAFFLVLTASCHNPAKEIKKYDYCYSNRSGVFVVSKTDKQDVRIKVNGSDVSLSPDGTELAYSDYGAPNQERRIGLMNLGTKQITILDSNCHNCYGPVWSPDGKYLAYNAFTDNGWSIKYVVKENGHPVMLAKSVSMNDDKFSPTWSADSKKIVLHDMQALYMLDLNGAIIKTIPFKELDTTFSPSSDTHIRLSKNEDKIFFETQVYEDPGDGEPPSAIFVYDLMARKSTRISPKGYNCFHPVIKGDTIFCSGTKGSSRRVDIYSMDFNGGHFNVAFKNRMEVSFRLF